MITSARVAPDELVSKSVRLVGLIENATGEEGGGKLRDNTIHLYHQKRWDVTHQSACTAIMNKERGKSVQDIVNRGNRH